MNKRMNEARLLAMLLLVTSAAASAAPVYQYVGCSSCAARIPDATAAGDGVVAATISVPSTICGGAISGYGVQLDIAHTSIGDLTADVKNPGATSINLVNRPSSAKCRGDDIAATFVDGGAAQVCGTHIPALGGDTQSNGSIAALGTALQPGIWTVTVRDQSPGEDGFLNYVQLRMICSGISDDIFNDSFEIP
jgi:subtilisin-like proprotein convertase family protein